MAWAVTFTSAAERSLGKLDHSVVRRIKPRVLALADDPRPHNCTKLVGHQDLYRIRIGDYRIVYRVDDAKEIVEITVVANRREVYRDL